MQFISVCLFLDFEQKTVNYNEGWNVKQHLQFCKLCIFFLAYAYFCQFQCNWYSWYYHGNDIKIMLKSVKSVFFWNIPWFQRIPGTKTLSIQFSTYQGKEHRIKALWMKWLEINWTGNWHWIRIGNDLVKVLVCSLCKS